MLVLATSVASSRSPEVPMFAETVECVGVTVDEQDNIAATTAVASRGTAVGHILFAPESNRPVAAVASRDENAGLIVEHDGVSLPQAESMSRTSPAIGQTVGHQRSGGNPDLAAAAHLGQEHAGQHQSTAEKLQP